MKKIISIVISICLITVLSIQALATADIQGIKAPSAVLFDSSGQMLFEKNGNEQLQPASVTKVMTMLLVMEAIENGQIKWEDMVTCSDYASSMGGTQIYLKPGEEMSVEDMFKSLVVSSANDAAVALAEHIAGSEATFVEQMNQRARELGMKDSTFINANGLDGEDVKTITSAYDIALASCELLKHDRIRDYTTIWMDTIRNGEFGLANTNKMLRQYNGMTGLKTGWIRKSGYCISATAMRDGMELVAVVMAADTPENRMADAAALLNYGFANYMKIVPEVEGKIPAVLIALGKEKTVEGELREEPSLLIEKGTGGNIEQSIVMKDDLKAPIEKGQTIGTLVLMSGDKELLTASIVAKESVLAMSWGDIYKELLESLFMKNK